MGVVAWRVADGMKLSSSGRGTGYSRRRGIVESILTAAYRGDWPAWLWERYPGSCDVHVVRRPFRLLPPGCPELRIGFASDLHIGPTTPSRLLDDAADKLAAEDLDVLLLGGDYVFLDASAGKASALEAFIRRARARRTLAVLGNHDLWTTHGRLEESLAAAGATLIVNGSVRLEAPHEAVTLIGLDDPWTGAPDAERAFRDSGSAEVRVVLCHSPDAVPLIEGRGVSLFLCGHTHGGHVALPWGPVIVPGPIGKEMPAGFYEAHGAKVFVSRGLGGIELACRTFAPPDVGVFTLTP